VIGMRYVIMVDMYDRNVGYFCVLREFKPIVKCCGMGGMYVV
jgi:hypothetical protein